MKRFLAIYMGSADGFERAGWNKLDPAARKAREADGMKAWMDWATAHARQIVDPGSPLGKTRRAARDGIADTKNAMTAYTIVEAESLEAAAALFADHPHFTMFPGDSVEIMECLPMPGG